MNNISTNLLRFNGEIGPQYLDPDDKTGGPDGTMKPITKDVLREMIMLNLPEIQKVQDEYVKAELESIKQTQQQILQRLNQPINTQLTGSNMNVAYGSYDQTINVNAGQAMSIKIEPPENEVWKLQVLRVDFPPVNGATTGNHRLIISTGTVGSAGGILDAHTAHNKRLFVVSNRFSEDTVVDISKEWVQYAIRETFVSKEAPLYLYYLNQTDANIVNAQIPIRITRVVYKK